MFKTFKRLILTAGLTGLTALAVQAQQGDLVEFQPKLMEGDSPVDGVVKMRIVIYPDATSDQVLYEDTANVTVSSGMYSTMLGDDTVQGSLTAAIAGDRAYLEMTVDDVKLPRRPIGIRTMREARKAAVRGGPLEIPVVSDVSRQVNLGTRTRRRPAVTQQSAADRAVSTPDGSESGANRVAGGVVGATIGGGGSQSEPNRVERNFGTIGGGTGNQVDGSFGTVGGGVANRAAGPRSVVGGGRANVAAGATSTVSGGYTNSAAGDYATIGGGWKNEATGYVATIGGGWENVATGLVSTVGGGQYNKAFGSAATVGGGWQNQADGAAATVVGGRNNTASGDYSLAAGHQAGAFHNGAFVWSGEINAPMESTAPGQFLVQAPGNVGIDTDSPREKLTVAGNIAPDQTGTHTLGTRQQAWTAVHVTDGIHYSDSLALVQGSRTNLVLDRGGNMGVAGSVAATAFVGDGSRLTGIRPPLPQAGVGTAHLSDGAVTLQKLDVHALDERYALAEDAMETKQTLASLGITSSEDTLSIRAADATVLRIRNPGQSPTLVAGHPSNTVVAASAGATISGGGKKGSPNVAEGDFTVIAGGMGNQVVGPYGTIGGGFGNQVHNSGSTIAGGIQNYATNWNATVGGGRENQASGLGATIGGGRGNIASNRYATIPGGYFNTASGAGAAVAGGFANTASGFIATIPGGSQNEATGEYSLAAGRRAKARHDGAYVWADATDEDFASTQPNQVIIRAGGGVGIGTTNTPEQLTVRGNIVPDTGEPYSLGTADRPWETLHLAGGIEINQGLVVSREGKNLLSIDDNGNIVVEGMIKAAAFDGPGSTSNTTSNSNPGATEFANQSIPGSALADGAVTSRVIKDRSIGLDDVDLRVFDNRYSTIQTLSNAISTAIAEVVDDFSSPVTNLDFSVLDARYATDEAVSGTVAASVASAIAEHLENRPDIKTLDARYASAKSLSNAVKDAVATAVADIEMPANDVDLDVLDGRYVQTDALTNALSTAIAKAIGEIEFPAAGPDLAELDARYATPAGVATDIAAAVAELDLSNTVSSAVAAATKDQLDLDTLDGRYARTDDIPRVVASSIDSHLEGHLDLETLDARYTTPDAVSSEISNTVGVAISTATKDQLDLETLDARYTTPGAVSSTISNAVAELTISASNLDLDTLDGRYARTDDIPKVVASSIDSHLEGHLDLDTLDARYTTPDAVSSEISNTVGVAISTVTENQLDLDTLDARYTTPGAVSSTISNAVAELTISASNLDLDTLDGRYARTDDIPKVVASSIDSHLEGHLDLDTLDARYTTPDAVSSEISNTVGVAISTVTENQLDLDTLDARYTTPGAVSSTISNAVAELTISASNLDLDTLDGRYARTDDIPKVVASSIDSHLEGHLDLDTLDARYTTPGAVSSEISNTVGVAISTVTENQLDLDTLDARYTTPDAVASAISAVTKDQLDLETLDARYTTPGAVSSTISNAVAELTISASNLDLDTLDGRYAQNEGLPDTMNTIVDVALSKFTVDAGKIVDGTIGISDIDVTQFDQRYAKADSVATAAVAAGSSPTIEPSSITSEEIANGTVSAQDLDLQTIDPLYVNLTGDRMTGPLALPANGLQVGAADLAVTNGMVGIGTVAPTATLDVEGTLRIAGGNPGVGKVLTSDANGVAEWKDLPEPTRVETSPEDYQFAPVFGPKTDQPLVLQVRGAQALRIEPGSESPNLIGGSSANTTPPRTEGVTISGGGSRDMPNLVNNPYGVIGGGKGNLVKGPYAVVGGGWANQANGPRSTIAGGRENVASGVAAVVSGGFTNTAQGGYAAIGGGWGNLASGYVSTLGGGWGNSATGTVSTIGGGQDNVASGSGSTISGGWKNRASGLGATVPGGKSNLAEGDFSVAMGYRATALHNGSFVWKDADEDDFASTAENQFLIKAAGNVGIDTDSPDEKLTVAGTVKADRFMGDGSALTGLPSGQPAPGSIDNSHIRPGAGISPEKIAGTALTTQSKFEGDVQGIANLLRLTPGTVGAQHLTPELQQAIANAQSRPIVTQAVQNIAFSAIDIADGEIPGAKISPESIGLRELDLDALAEIAGNSTDLEDLTNLLEQLTREMPDLNAIQDLNVAGTLTADRIVGDGSELTNLNVPIPDGSVNAAKLSPNLLEQLTREIPDLNAIQDLNVAGTLTANRIVGDGSGLTRLPFAALEIPTNSIDSDAIAPSSIYVEHLSKGLAELVSREMPRIEDLTDLRLRGTVSAGQFVGDGSRLQGLRFEALRIPEGAIAGDRIAKGSISRDHLADDVLQVRIETNRFWQVGGNDLAGRTPSRLGTRGNNGLDLIVSDQPALRLVPTSGTPNLIGGHPENTVAPAARGVVIAGGGEANSPNRANQSHATIGGGIGNEAASEFATIGGGFGNLATGFDATISGGQDNRSTGSGAFVGGGYTNTAGGSFSAVPGGAANQASGNVAAIGGGFGNIAAGSHAIVPGGSLNSAAGDYSLAAGRRAKALHPGSFVWADATDADAPSTQVNQFVVRASGGVRLYADAGMTSGAALAPGSGSWAMLSDRSAKENFTPADPREILDSVVQLPVWTWNYRTQAEDIRHIGPVSQDFRAAFGLGENDTHISTVDMQGVTLTAIQGLHALVQEKSERIETLENANRTMADRLTELEVQIHRLHSERTEPNASQAR